jgi:predicted nucleotidyltransferase component of viral defense system
VPPDTVDKDYVLGHFLSVFASHYQNELIFKGGTCLRKCYIEGYRFSEDLDFTAFDGSFTLDQKDVRQVAIITERKTGIRFHVGRIKNLVFQNEHKGFQADVKYWGPIILKTSVHYRLIAGIQK